MLYVTKKRQELKLSLDHHALVLYDKFKGHAMYTSNFGAPTGNNFDIVFVPANCTDRLQPLDVSVNKAAKNFMHEQFQHWYAEQIMQQTKSGTSLRKPVDLKLSIVKPLTARWFVQLEDYLKSCPDIIKNGFTRAGITADYLLN